MVSLPLQNVIIKLMYCIWLSLSYIMGMCYAECCTSLDRVCVGCSKAFFIGCGVWHSGSTLASYVPGFNSQNPSVFLSLIHNNKAATSFFSVAFTYIMYSWVLGALHVQSWGGLGSEMSVSTSFQRVCLVWSLVWVKSQDVGCCKLRFIGSEPHSFLYIVSGCFPNIRTERAKKL